jgi:hypothetical protein
VTGSRVRRSPIACDATEGSALEAVAASWTIGAEEQLSAVPALRDAYRRRRSESSLMLGLYNRRVQVAGGGLPPGGRGRPRADRARSTKEGPRVLIATRFLGGMAPDLGLCGAGEGNRTLMTSLEGWGSAIELRPQCGCALRRSVPGRWA